MYFMQEWSSQHFVEFGFNPSPWRPPLYRDAKFPQLRCFLCVTLAAVLGASPVSVLGLWLTRKGLRPDRQG